MNILTALLDWMTPPERPDSAPPLDPYPAYIASLVQEAGRCASAGALLAYIGDHSGYVREAAIRRCVELARPECLGAVVPRLNDWVPQIRQAARSAVMTLLPFAPTEELLATFPAIAALARAGRTDHAEWIAQFEQALMGMLSTDDLIAGASGADIKIARACFALLKRHGLLDPPVLFDLMLSSRNDIVVAVDAIQLCADLPADSRRARYLAAAKSHFGAVRTIALRSLLSDQGLADRGQLAVAALFELQTSVREVAITYLKADGFDLRAYYREALRSGALPAKLVQVGLVSLASLGNTEDIKFFKGFAGDRHASVRRAALSAWFRLAGHDKDLIATQALMDDAAGVRKFALRMVRRYGAYIPYATVETTLEARGDVLLLLRFSESQKWDWLSCIARHALRTPADSPLVAALSAAMEAWVRQAGGHYETATAEQKRFLTSEETLSALEKLLNPHQRWLMSRVRQELST